MNTRAKLLLAFLTLFFIVLSVRQTRGQVTNSFSPTPTLPASPSIPTIPLINQETLADPEAFKLDQQIKQATRELFKALTPNGQPSIIENKAVQRKNLMKQAISKYPYVFLGNVLTSTQISSFDTQMQEQYFERSLTLSNAELGVTHIDDFEKHENSRFDYSLQNLAEHKQYNFYPAGDFGGHISGTILNINGVALDNDITTRVMGAPQGGDGNNVDPVFTNLEILKEASPDALGPQKVAVILLKEKQVQNPYYSKEQIEDIIFKGEVQKFIKEASYGKTWLDEERSKIYGWYETSYINLRSDAAYNLIQEVISLVDNDIDFTQFDRIMIGVSKWFKNGDTGVVHTNTRGGWGNVGKGTYTTFDGDIYLTFSAFGVGHNLADTAAHELGHNFGVHHANSWNCSEGSLKGNCEHDEYGNIFDVMGTGYLRHFNGYFKEVFQWLNKPVINITSSGKYNLQPLEFPEAVVAKISRPGASKFPIYYLETRTPVGFDDDTNLVVKDVIRGVHINWVNEPLKTRFLTLNHRIKAWIPSNGGFIAGSSGKIEPLYTGQSFRDEKAGLTITNLDDKTVNVELEESSCKYYDFETKIQDIYVYEFGEGWTPQAEMICNDLECVLKRNNNKDLIFTFYLTSKNQNSYACPDSNIRGSLNDPWKKYPEYAQDYWLVPSGDTGYLTPAAIIPATVPAGTYRITVSVENVGAGQAFFSTGRDLKIIDEFQTLEGDLTADGKVDIFDLVTVAKDFGKKGEGLAGDADRDGDVDIFDLVLVARNFGKKLE